jgi:2-oxoisovalerate ferredoxin oxidoreductase beta subunit
MAKEILQRPDAFYGEFFRKPGANPLSTHYCPGCGHGVVHKLIAEALHDFGVRERAIFVSPVGCSVFGYYYFNCGNVQVAHGRAPAVATGIKRALPHAIVLSYQGDGDLAAIGGNNILQAANRGENITVIFVNNAIYGMTGSQMAPTTLIGQKTTTTPWGRSAENEGYPMRVCELLATLEAPVYIERVAIADPKHVMKARKAIRKGIQNQIDRKGFSLVGVLSPCPTGWKMTPIDAKDWVIDSMFKYFELNVFKDKKDSGGNGNDHPTIQKFKNPTTENILSIIGKDQKSVKTFSPPEIEVKYRNPHLKISGFGGQGILLLGQLLAESAMVNGYQSTWLPSYGPEMRGGTANCHVIISDSKIGSPLVQESDVLIAMNLPSLDKFENEVRSGGVILVNSSLIERKVQRDDVETVYLPATELAHELGSAKVANMVMLGAYLGYTGLLNLDAVLHVAGSVIKRKEFMEINDKALKTGSNYIKSELVQTLN